MLQKQSILESNAIKSLQEMYSDEEEEDNIDDCLKAKSPIFSGWDSPQRTSFQFYTDQSERSKSNRRTFESPIKAKSKLSHLSENLQRYHFQAFHLKKESLDEKQETNMKKTQDTINQYQNRQKDFSRNKHSRYTVSEGIKQYEERKYLDITQQNDQTLTDSSYTQGILCQNTKQTKIQKCNDNQNEDQNLAKKNKKFNLYTEQPLAYNSIQTEQSSTYYQTQSSRQSTCSSKQQDHRQQANLSVNNIDLYQIEETTHPNKDFKSTFRVIWKKQEKLSLSQSRKGSLEQIFEKNLTCTNLSTRSSRQETESHSLTNQGIEQVEEPIAKNKVVEEEKQFQIVNCQIKPETIRLKNIYQKQSNCFEKEKNSDFQLFDYSKIQTIFINNLDSENTTQVSTRKSSAKSVFACSTNANCTKPELTNFQSNFDIRNQNSKDSQLNQIPYQNDLSSLLVNELIIPLHSRIKIEQQHRERKNINRPISNNCNKSQLNNGAAYSDNQMRLQKTTSFEEQVQLETQKTASKFYQIQINTNQEINHKSFKQYNIPVTLRSRSLQKRQFSSRKASNASVNCRSNSISLNDTLLFNIYKSHQVPEIQQKINAYIQNQEEQLKQQYSHNQSQQTNNQQSNYIFQSPLKNKNYRKYKPQFKLETQVTNQKSNLLNSVQIGNILIYPNS